MQRCYQEMKKSTELTKLMQKYQICRESVLEYMTVSIVYTIITITLCVEPLLKPLDAFLVIWGLMIWISIVWRFHNLQPEAFLEGTKPFQ